MQRTTSTGRLGPNQVWTTFSAGSSHAAPRSSPSQRALFPMLHDCLAAGADTDVADADVVDGRTGGGDTLAGAAETVTEGTRRTSMNAMVSSAAAARLAPTRRICRRVLAAGAERAGSLLSVLTGSGRFGDSTTAAAHASHASQVVAASCSSRPHVCHRFNWQLLGARSRGHTTPPGRRWQLSCQLMGSRLSKAAWHRSPGGALRAGRTATVLSQPDRRH